MDEDLKLRITDFFDYWRKRHAFISNLDLSEYNHEANVLLWGAIDALSNLWAENIGKEQCKKKKGKRIIFDAFLALYGGEVFQIVSLPDVWNRADRERNQPERKFNENIYKLLSTIGERRTPICTDEYKLRHSSDDLSIDAIVRATSSNYPETESDRLKEWLTLSRYIWNIVVLEINQPKRKFNENIYKLLSTIGERRTPICTDENIILHSSDDLSIDAIVRATSSNYPETDSDKLKEWLTLSRYIWNRVVLEINHPERILNENTYEFLSTIGERPKNPTDTNKYIIRQISDDLSIDNIVDSLLEKYPDTEETESDRLKEWLTLSRYGAIAYNEMRSAFIHEGRYGKNAHGFKLPQSANQPTYRSGIYTIPRNIGFAVEFMLPVLKSCIDAFEAEALERQKDPAPYNR